MLENSWIENFCDRLYAVYRDSSPSFSLRFSVARFDDGNERNFPPAAYHFGRVSSRQAAHTFSRPFFFSFFLFFFSATVLIPRNHFSCSRCCLWKNRGGKRGRGSSNNMVKSFKRVPATWNGWPRTWSTHYKATYFPLFPPSLSPLFSLLFFFFLDYLHVSCPPMVTQSRSSLNPETSPAFVGRCCIAGRDECDESFENSAKTNLFSFFLREVSLQFWILFFFFEKKLGRMAPRRGRNFWARIQREEFCRVIEISYDFFFPSKLKLKLFFFFIEFEFTFFKRSYRF